MTSHVFQEILWKSFKGGGRLWCLENNLTVEREGILVIWKHIYKQIRFLYLLCYFSLISKTPFLLFQAILFFPLYKLSLKICLMLKNVIEIKLKLPLLISNSKNYTGYFLVMERGLKLMLFQCSKYDTWNLAKYSLNNLSLTFFFSFEVYFPPIFPLLCTP